MFRSTSALLLCACLLGLSVTSAEAQANSASTSLEIDPIDIPPEKDPLAHAWDHPLDRGGFYARATIGLGFQSTHLGPAPWKESEQGRLLRSFATGFSLDLGYMLAPWAALHLSTHAGVLWDADVEPTFGREADLSARVAAYGAGPGVTFFTRRDFYLGLALGVGLAHTRYPGYNRLTDPGFFMSVIAGKDLYTGRNVSFGLQMQMVYMLLGADRTMDEARVRQFLFGFSVGFDSI
jgi:hypothetical protein